MKYILVLLADWANGVFAVVCAAYLTGVEILWWYFFVGVLCAHLPDLDGVGELFKRGELVADAENPREHREGLHYPFVWILGGIGLVVAFGFWGYVFLFATLLHFINDFYGTGWGIKWLWPFTSRHYKLLSRRANLLKFILKEQNRWEALPNDEKRLRIIVSWSQEELPEYIRTYGLTNWMERYYYNINATSATEYLLSIIACVLVIATLV